MRIRNVVHEFEVKLDPPVDSPQTLAHGKGEWKVYENGTRQCKLSVTKLRLADGTVLELIVNDRQTARLVVQQGIVRYRQESQKGESVPTVEANQLVQVVHSGQVILEGRFYSE
jgi:hypothetical protein